MGLMDIMRAALPGAVAARTGYLQGQDDRAARNAAAATAQQKQVQTEQRQSLLDDMARQMHDANLAHTKAETEKLMRPEPAKPMAAPTSRNTADGIEEWDSVKGVWVKTGKKPYRAPAAVPVSERPPAIAAKQQQETKDALAGVNRQIDDTRASLGPLERGLPDISRVFPRATSSDSTTYNTNKPLIQKMKQRLDSLTNVSDSLNAEVQGRPAKAAAPSRAPAPSGGGRGGGGTPPRVDPIDAKLTDAQVVEAMRAGATSDDAVRQYWKQKGGVR